MSRKFMSPLTLGFIVSGILFFAIVAVVRYATTDTSSIDSLAAAGAASLQQVAAQNNVGQAIQNELPTFHIEPVQSEALYATVAVQDSPFPTDPEWLTTATDEIGRRWVWGGTWFDCPFVVNASDDFFMDELGAVRTRDLKGACQ